jgi:hypothetical protein
MLKITNQQENVDQSNMNISCHLEGKAIVKKS